MRTHFILNIFFSGTELGGPITPWTPPYLRPCWQARRRHRTERRPADASRHVLD